MILRLALLVAFISWFSAPARAQTPTAPRLLPTPQDSQYDLRILDVQNALIATDGQQQNLETAGLLARRLRAVLKREIPIAVPEDDPGPGVSLFVIGDPMRLTWLNGITELWELAPPAARANPEGYYLVTVPAAGGRNYIVCASRAPRGCYYAVQSLLQLLEPMASGARLPRANVADWPQFRNRGIIEGFYGTPWTWSQRESMIEFAGRNKMNWFILAPKEAPWHRSHWQIPHTAEEIRSLSRLNQIANAHFVNFCYALSPGRTMNYVSPTDLDLLLAKIGSVQRLGVRNFALLMDDIPFKLRSEAERRRFKSIEDAHLFVAIRFYRAIKKRDPSAQMFFCPTQYHGARPFESSYAKSLGARLPKEVQVFWTGPGVVSLSLTEQDSDVVARTLHRPPFYWDNFPVNDYDRTRFFLGPLAQRAPYLHAHCAGLVANPMNEAEASKLPLMTVADYLWNPLSYQPQRSWEAAVTRLSDPQLTPSVRAIARLSAPNRFWQQDGLNLAQRITQFWSSLERGNGEAEAMELRRTFDELRDHAATLAERPLPTGMTNELARLITQTYALSILGAEAIEVARAARQGELNSSYLAQSLRQRAQRVEMEQTREGLVSCPALDAMREFVRYAALPPAAAGRGRITLPNLGGLGR